MYWFTCFSPVTHLTRNRLTQPNTFDTLSCCDIGGPKYPWPAVNREMKSSRVRLSPGCHRVIELSDDPRIVVLTRHHKWIQMVLLYEEHGIRKPRVHGEGREIIVQLPMIISIPAANIPLDGVAGKVRPRMMDPGDRSGAPATL